MFELCLNGLTTLNSMYNAVGSQLLTLDLRSNSWPSTICPLHRQHRFHQTPRRILTSDLAGEGCVICPPDSGRRSVLALKRDAAPFGGRSQQPQFASSSAASTSKRDSATFSISRFVSSSPQCSFPWSPFWSCCSSALPESYRVMPRESSSAPARLSWPCGGRRSWAS